MGTGGHVCECAHGCACVCVCMCMCACVCVCVCVYSIVSEHTLGGLLYHLAYGLNMRSSGSVTSYYKYTLYSGDTGYSHII